LRERILLHSPPVRLGSARLGSALCFFISVSIVPWRSELAKTNIFRAATAVEEKNKKVVRRLYEALGTGDAKTVQRILAPDLEWRFHGPPSCQHLMSLLTGRSTHTRFSFDPDSITALSHNLVVAEGREDESVYWVHVWTLENAGCTVTELREYFNTSLVVTEFNPPSSSCSSSSSTSAEQGQMQRCSVPLWQSHLIKSNANSMPGLVLAV